MSENVTRLSCHQLSPGISLSSIIQDACLARQILVDNLRSLQNRDGYWDGALSNSALSTATAVSALALCLRENNNASAELKSTSQQDTPVRWKNLVEQGSAYLHASQNDDGGFGDTNRSHSNIATTYLVIAAWRLAGKDQLYETNLRRAEAYIDRHGGWEGLRRRYGKDKTFVVPILSNCALAGMVPWHAVSPLPFEAAALPQSWYRFAQMPVVSYAIPALVAIGQSRFVHAPTRNPILWLMRKLTLNRTRKVLLRMQPDSGGYLEATPLTSFVLMNLASIGQISSQVAINCRKFIIESVQADGSWPIDTNLAGWVTSLAIHALVPTTPVDSIRVVSSETIDWLLQCQHLQRHPFTGAEPGGWGWTNLSGAVPDADDTPAAMLALHAWYRQSDDPKQSEKILTAVAKGIDWLLKLQNRDGGWPTFCRGWGKLPFDRSGADLTAHAIRALSAWSLETDPAMEGRNRVANAQQSSKIGSAIQRGLRYLRKVQRSDGSWLPLWFGNQDHPQEENATYGTARILLALGDLATSCRRVKSLEPADVSCAQNGIRFLLSQQNADGGWGGGSSIRYPSGDVISATNSDLRITSTIEETSVAIEGLSACRSLALPAIDRSKVVSPKLEEIDEALDRAVVWLASKVKSGDCDTSQPIGFYFAKLWYYERLYPYVFAAAALRRFIDSKQVDQSNLASDKDQGISS